MVISRGGRRWFGRCLDHKAPDRSARVGQGQAPKGTVEFDAGQEHTARIRVGQLTGQALQAQLGFGVRRDAPSQIGEFKVAAKTGFPIELERSATAHAQSGVQDRRQLAAGDRAGVQRFGKGGQCALQVGTGETAQVELGVQVRIGGKRIDANLNLKRFQNRRCVEGQHQGQWATRSLTTKASFVGIVVPIVAEARIGIVRIGLHQGEHELQVERLGVRRGFVVPTQMRELDLEILKRQARMPNRGRRAGRRHVGCGA